MVLAAADTSYAWVSQVVTIATVGLVIWALRRRNQHLTGTPVIPIHPLVPPRVPARPVAGDEPARPVSPIETVRELLGPPPREIPSSLEKYVHADPPKWLAGRKDDEMLQAFVRRDLMRREGNVVWAAVVQAKPGPIDHGASIVWSEDPYYDEHAQELSEIGHELFGV